jgi:hypothetical protein
MPHRFCVFFAAYLVNPDFCQSEAARFDAESVNGKPFSARSYDPVDGAGIEPATHGFSESSDYQCFRLVLPNKIIF